MMQDKSEEIFLPVSSEGCIHENGGIHVTLAHVHGPVKVDAHGFEFFKSVVRASECVFDKLFKLTVTFCV